MNVRGVGDETELAETVSTVCLRTHQLRQAFRGGYAGCFRDPDIHLWEVAFDPDLAAGS